MLVVTVPMVMFVLWEALISTRVEWKCASMTSGGQCVVMVGTVLMLLWSASSWDMHTLEVSIQEPASDEYKLTFYVLTLLLVQVGLHIAMLILVPVLG